MKIKCIKRCLAFLLSIAMVFGMIPMSMITAQASDDTVYLSVSVDGKYIDGKDGSAICRVPVSLSELANIKLGNYSVIDGYTYEVINMSDYIYDSNGDGIEDITALHLYIYAHEIVYGGKWSDVMLSGAPGSIYFISGMFGYDSCNLNYYVNGKYPLQYDAWGATADICVLEPGDFVDIASYADWNAWWGGNNGFRYFTDDQGQILHNLNAKTDETLVLNLTRHYANMMGDCITQSFPSADSTVYYGKTAFDENADYVKTDENGVSAITFKEAGTWYIWSYGEYGDEGTIVNAPAYAVVEVEGEHEPVLVPNNAPALTDGYAMGTETATVTVGQEYRLNLSEVFHDPDGDFLTYYLNSNELTDLIDGTYSYVPTVAGTETFVFQASDGKEDSETYTVTLTAENPVSEASKLQSLTIYRQVDKKTSPLVAPEGGVLPFHPDTTAYIISNDLRAIEDKNNNTLYFCAVPENETDIVTLYYKDSEGNQVVEDITSETDMFKNFKFISSGKNEFEIVVSSREENIESTTYKFEVHAKPTLSNTTVESIYPVFLNKQLGVNNKSQTITVPEVLQQLTVNATAKYEGGTITYNGATSNVVDISNADKIEIVITKEGLSSDTYTLNLDKVKGRNVSFKTVPSDATVTVTATYKKPAANYVLSNNVEEREGQYPLIFNSKNITYSYEVRKEGYLPKTGTIEAMEDDNLELAIELTRNLGPQPEEVEDVDWKNFRNSDVNMAITSVMTPTTKVSLKWNLQLGDGWGAAPSVPIIVDNNIVAMVGRKLCMFDAETGTIVKEADMVGGANFGYTPPTYANGMIFCPLTDGTIQAFNATTFESLWVYRDELGGQSLSPITYSDGYVYTGFWNGESRDANYVCIFAADEDITQTTEPKIAEWKHRQNGGFYWAGSVAIGEVIIVGTDDGGAEGTVNKSYLYSFDRKTGEVISQHELLNAGDQRSSIAYDEENSRIYFTTKGGYLYSAHVAQDGKVTDLKGVYYNAQITATPVVYKGKVYFGIGSGISTSGSTGSFVVADANTLEKLFAVEMKGYPQASALLSTAYEEEGWLYFYLTYNNKPGGISLVKIKTDADTAEDVQLMEIYEASGFEEFCIASIVCDENGTLYYKNDSANMFAVAPATVQTVIDLIDQIGSVTLESETAIKAAREAYDSLNENDKVSVINYHLLVEAEDAWNELNEDQKNEEKDTVGAQLSKDELALLAQGKLVLTKTELLEFKELFEKIDVNTSYDEVLLLLQAFYQLESEQQLALENTENVELAQSIIAKYNHTDTKTGIKAEGLEWNISLHVNKSENTAALKEMREKIEEGTILSMWDISMENVVTGEDYKTNKAVKVKIPKTLVVNQPDFDYFKVIHYTDGGQLEILNCNMEGDYIVFSMADAGTYAIGGFMNMEEKDSVLLNTGITTGMEEASNGGIIWLVVALAGTVTLGVLIFARKRMQNER